MGSSGSVVVQYPTGRNDSKRSLNLAQPFSEEIRSHPVGMLDQRRPARDRDSACLLEGLGSGIHDGLDGDCGTTGHFDVLDGLPSDDLRGLVVQGGVELNRFNGLPGQFLKTFRMPGIAGRSAVGGNLIALLQRLRVTTNRISVNRHATARFTSRI